MTTNGGTARPKHQIYWNLTTRCNLDCSFCNVPQSQSEDEVKFVRANLETFKRRFKDLSGQWEFFIGGGEPFVFPGFLTLVRDLVEMGHDVSVATNFTASQKMLLDFVDSGNGHIRSMVASFKPGIHDFSSFLEKAQKINESIKAQGGVFTVGAVATKKDMDALYQLGLEFQNHGIIFQLQVERADGKYRTYSKAEVEKIRHFGRIYGLEGTAHYKGLPCLAGKHYFVLTQYGHAFRCHSAIAGRDLDGGYLGNLLKGGLHLHKQPQRCPYEHCNCVNAYNLNLIKS